MVADETRIVRALQAGDIEALVVMDQAYSGRSRRGFFEKRLQAMEREPDSFIGLTATEGARTIGFVLGHLLDGEFGTEARTLVLDGVGVDAKEHRRGTGTSLLERFVDEGRRRGAREVRTRVQWGEPRLMAFFAASSCRLAARTVLERTTSDAGF